MDERWFLIVFGLACIIVGIILYAGIKAILSISVLNNPWSQEFLWVPYALFIIGAACILLGIYGFIGGG